MRQGVAVVQKLHDIAAPGEAIREATKLRAAPQGEIAAG